MASPSRISHGDDEMLGRYRAAFAKHSAAESRNPALELDPENRFSKESRSAMRQARETGSGKAASDWISAFIEEAGNAVRVLRAVSS